MPLIYKIDAAKALKEKGITTYAIRKSRLISEGTLQKLRDGEPIGWYNLQTLCRLLECQPGDILAYIPDQDQDREQGPQG